MIISTEKCGLMKPIRKGVEALHLVALILFSSLLINFLIPTLSFMISFFELPVLFVLTDVFDMLLFIFPFVVLVLFYWTLRVSARRFREISRSLILQAVIALPIFVIWFERNLIHASGYLAPISNFVTEVTYFLLIDILYIILFVMLWRSVKGTKFSLSLNSRFEMLYLWLNLMFLVSIALHFINRIDFVYYFRFYMPAELSWLFGYAPTILVSATCLAGWIFFLSSTKPKVAGWLIHIFLVAFPVVFVVLVEIFRPLIGFVITSAIVWGTSYEFFRPVVYSLSLVLAAVGAFFSFSIMLHAQATTRSRNLIRLGLGSTVLAGVSPSLVSVLGVSTSLYVLLHGIMPREGAS